MANPLFRIHARRAMSDVPCESFVMLGLFFGLAGWRSLLGGGSFRVNWLGAVLAGVFAGLALLSKLSGLLALMVLAAWAALALVLHAPISRKLAVLATLAVAIVTAAGVRVALDPYLTAHPSGALSQQGRTLSAMSLRDRVKRLGEHRLEMSAGQKRLFPDDALNTLGEKLAVTAVQGFGRFGPFGRTEVDSRVRFDRRQDWGAALWLPLVAAGVAWAAVRGKAQVRAGEPPTAWAVLVHYAVALAVVAVYLPMAWDRYQLPIQAPACLLASGALVAAARTVRLGLRRDADLSGA
jgi:hypothetical protein